MVLHDDAQHLTEEWRAKKFWPHFLQRHVFNTNNSWIWSSEQPRSGKSGDTTKIDYVVDRKNNGDQIIRMLAIEVKHYGNQKKFRTECEIQAHQACKMYKECNDNCDLPIYALTCIGTKVALWEYDKKLRSNGCILSNISGPGSDKNGYCEIKSEAGTALVNELRRIRDTVLLPRCDNQ